MEREVIEHSGMEMFAEVGLVLFVIAFVLVLARVFLMKKDHSQQMRHMPLDEGESMDAMETNPEVSR